MHCAADDSAQRGATGGCARCAATRALASDFQCSMPAVRPVSRAGDCAADGVPGVAGYITPPDATASNPCVSTRFLLSPAASCGFESLPLTSPADPVTILVGPESGLDDAEEQAAIKRGFIAIHLGPRILRTETAG